MTRINCIDPEQLHPKHLVAEYRELPRIFSLVHKAILSNRIDKIKIPSSYILGTGHVKFFYDKLLYLSRRHADLVREMIKRNYNPQFVEDLHSTWKDYIPEKYWNDWKPTQESVKINVQRINDRLESMSKK